VRTLSLPVPVRRAVDRCRGLRALPAAAALGLASLVLPVLAAAPASAAGAGPLPRSSGRAAWVAGFSGTGVAAYGDAMALANFAGITVTSPLVAMAPTPDGKGYWVAAADGGVFAFGDAKFYGSMGAAPLYAPIVGIATTPDGRGYWLAAADGGVFAFGDARFHGSTGGRRLAAPIVAIVATPDGRGYWMAAADGGVFAFGDARFRGSAGGEKLAAPVTAMAVTADGRGYWLAGADGGVFTFGDAHYYGSAANVDIGTWVTGIAPSAGGRGYWLAAATAGVLPYGTAAFYGPKPNLPPFPPTAAIAATPDGKGYWLLQPNSVHTTFASPRSGSTAAGEAAVALAATQVGPDPDAPQGQFCNPYGPCEEWCALFATWDWNAVGLAIPGYSWVPDIGEWAWNAGRLLPADAMPAPGDLLLYGSDISSLPHVAVVAEVWPDGELTTVDGDSGPEPYGKYAVTSNGPFLPSDSQSYNGMPVFGYVST
jgi:hypothetical protein